MSAASAAARSVTSTPNRDSRHSRAAASTTSSHSVDRPARMGPSYSASASEISPSSRWYRPRCHQLWMAKKLPDQSLADAVRNFTPSCWLPSISKTCASACTDHTSLGLCSSAARARVSACR